MTEPSKITPSHLARLAVVYVRQSTNAQVECNRESTQRQYQLRTFAAQLGWPAAAIRVIDQDLGLSGSGLNTRSGFAALTAEVALGHVGIVLALEVSRLARNNADWYRLLDLCGTTDTLIGDADGLYHPGLFNDRLVLGLKGTMSEAELHVLRARLNGGIRHKAARGELRRGLPIGLVWGEADGEVRFHPDEAVVDGSANMRIGGEYCGVPRLGAVKFRHWALRPRGVWRRRRVTGKEPGGRLDGDPPPARRARLGGHHASKRLHPLTGGQRISGGPQRHMAAAGARRHR